MTFYLMSLALLWPLYNKGKKFIPVIFLLIAAQICLTMVYCSWNHNDMHQVLSSTYRLPLFRVGPWIWGIFLGYILHENRDSKTEFKKVRKKHITTDLELLDCL